MQPDWQNPERSSASPSDHRPQGELRGGEQRAAMTPATQIGLAGLGFAGYRQAAKATALRSA